MIWVVSILTRFRELRKCQDGAELQGDTLDPDEYEASSEDDYQDDRESLDTELS